MKKILISLFIFLLSFGISYAATTNVSDFQTDRQICYSKMDSKCFYKLTFKYSSNSSQLNILKYDYAVALISEKEYLKAKSNLQSIIANEKQNAKLVAAAQEGIKKIDELQKNMRQAGRSDTGNYYQANSPMWKNPKNIKVYVYGRTGKEYLIKNAFKTWCQKSGYLVNVTFVTDPNTADIKCYYVNTVSKEHAGITNSKIAAYSNGKKYITYAEVKISLLNPYGGKYTDKNLESIALHEAGHALGINYHSDNINDIMYYSTESYKNGFLSNRDANTLKALYTSKS